MSGVKKELKYGVPAYIAAASVSLVLMSCLSSGNGGSYEVSCECNDTEYSPDKCAGCGRCAEVCPRDVFAMQDKRAVVMDKDLCMECGACALNCEYGAITVNSGVGCAAALINAW